MADWTQYKRISVVDARPYEPGEDMTNIAVHDIDKDSGSPREGDMIARDPRDHTAQWLMPKSYFEQNFSRV